VTFRNSDEKPRFVFGERTPERKVTFGEIFKASVHNYRSIGI
jgi:hypothetical protein